MKISISKIGLSSLLALLGIAMTLSLSLSPVLAAEPDDGTDPNSTTTVLSDPQAAFGLVGTTVSVVLTILIIFATVAAFIFLALGAVQWITARGGDGAAKGRATMKYAIVGLIIVSLTYVAIILINNVLPKG